jgi:hypothetical protein
VSGNGQVAPTRKGTAVSNIYQRKTTEASPTPVVPEQVLVSLGEIADSAQEGLLALAVGAGLQVMHAMMDADVVALAGPRGKHQPDRAAVRHGGGDGSVTLVWAAAAGAPTAGTRGRRLRRGAAALLPAVLGHRGMPLISTSDHQIRGDPSEEGP